MLKLCGFAVSNYYNKVKIALIEKGVPFQEEHVRPSQEPAVLARSAMGKMPFLDFGDGTTLTESQVMLEYLEDAYPDQPLYPREPLARARIRELIAHLELHLELPARRLYRAAFFGGMVSDETKQLVKAELDKGVRAFMKLAKFSPWVAGAEFTAADCAAAVHLPLISLATKTTYGTDVLDDHADRVKVYFLEAGERASIRKTNDDRKAYLGALQKK
jgi:glutathione S-transferase